MKLFVIGGFLGSGKTTALEDACRILRKDQKKVAICYSPKTRPEVKLEK